MRIRRIDIEQFGTVRQWHSGDLNEDVTVIYGPNEAGKSTITEFIRSTLFPVRTIKYPQAQKGDSGTIEIEMDNGDRRILQRDGKKVTEISDKRTVSEELNSMDSETYRALYGLDLDQLVNNKLITSGTFRSKFMTIPGGDDVPKISESIDARLSELMNPERMGNTKIIDSCVKDLKEKSVRIAEINANKLRYDELYAEREELKRKVSEAKTLIDASQNEKLRKRMMRSQSANMKKLSALEEEMQNYVQYESFDMEELNRFRELNKSIDELNSQLPEGVVDEKGYIIVTSRKEEIENAYRGLGEYESKFDRIDALEANNQKLDRNISEYEEKTGWSLSQAENVRTGTPISGRAELALRKEQGRSPIGPKSFMIGGAGILMLILGILVFTHLIDLGGATSFVGGAAAGIGFFAILYAFVLPNLQAKKVATADTWNDWIVSEGYPDGITPRETIILTNDLQRLKDFGKQRENNISEIRKLQGEISLYERTCEPLMKSLGIEGDVANGVEKLNVMLQQALVDEKEALRVKNLQDMIARKEKERASMIRKYGPEESIRESYEGKKELLRIRSEIATLTESIETSSGASLNDLRAFLDEDTELDMDELKDDSETHNQRIGEINAEMDSIMKDDELDELYACGEASQSKLADALREWAVYSIAQTLIRDACNHFYTDLQPTVVKSANRYLSLMTEGRYQLDNDPRNSEIFVRDSRSTKPASQWSSGLSDQVYLSLKMALARELSAEKIPVIMDDVLVRFDSDRKSGACRAIKEFAAEDQVIMFTCDTEVLNYLRMDGEVNEIRL